MKRVKVNTWQIGLVFRDKVYQRMLIPGSYWFWKKEKVHLYDITQEFHPPADLNILLEDSQLADALLVVDVKDHEVALHYENRLLKEVLTPGRYAFWRSVVRRSFTLLDTSKAEITEPIDRFTLQHKLVAPYVRSYTVESSEKAVLFVDGRFVKVLDSGVYYWFRNHIPVHVGKVDTRQQQLEINGQEILTRDKAALRINAWAQFRVFDIEKALVRNKEYDKQLYVHLQLALREYVGSLALDELLEKKQQLAAVVLEAVRPDAVELGIEVAGFGIRDVILPGDVKEIMNQVLVAEKKAQANIIMRREETASTRSLLNTAKLMEENSMLWKLKEMEYVEKIADKISHLSVHGNGEVVEQLKQLFVPKQS